MKILKTKKLFTYMVVGALVMALSISCKSNEEPQETSSTSSNHPSQGSYTASAYSPYPNANATVTINNDGTCTISGTAYFDANDSRYFSITVTKWWYSYSNPNTYYAGSNYEQSEVAINSPATDYFSVDYGVYSGEIYVVFGPEGKIYRTGTLTKQ